MIIFDLSCKQEHVFEGWFRSQANYDSQLENGLIACPHCGSIEIRRVPSAVHVAKTASSPAPKANDVSVPVTNTEAGMVAAYQQLISAIAAKYEDVGKDFAQEARKIHYMEEPQRSIRGEASADDYESLRDEGIEVMRLPSFKVKKEDLN